MSITSWHKSIEVVRGRYRSSVLAQYGAGLHTECEECADARVDVSVPAQRRHAATSSQANRRPVTT